jgi:hypothetical protein
MSTLKLSIKKDEFWMSDYNINITSFRTIEEFLKDIDLMLWRGEIQFETYQILVQSIAKNLN